MQAVQQPLLARKTQGRTFVRPFLPFLGGYDACLFDFPSFDGLFSESALL